MKRCVIFARVSMEKQSTDSQVDVLKKFAIDNNYTFTDDDIFTEKISGVKKDVNRKQLELAITRAINEKVDTLMVWELSRLTRLLDKFVEITRILEENKINLFIYSNNLNLLRDDKKRNEDDYMVMSIFASIANKEAVSIKERSIRGLKSSQQNLIFGGNTAYGYSRKDKKVVIDEEESKIVKKIFTLYLNGDGVKQIANQLNDLKIPTKYSKKFKDRTIKLRGGFDIDCNSIEWKQETVHSILTNNIYKGDKLINNELHHFEQLQIIDNDLFDKVQTKLKKSNTKQGKHIKQFYLLNNIPIICGVCGRNFHKKNNPKINTYLYKCYSIAFGKYKNIPNEKNIKCDNTTVNIDRLNDAIWYYVRRSDKLEEMINKNIKESSITQEINKATTKINEINSRIKTIERNIQSLLERELKGTPSNIIDRLMQPLLNEKKLIEGELNSCNTRLFDLKLFEEKQNNLNTILKNIKLDPHTMKEYIDKIVKSITVYPVRNEDFKLLSHHKQDNPVYIQLQLYASFEPLGFIISQREYKYKSNLYKILPMLKGEFSLKDNKIKVHYDRLTDRVKDIKYHIKG